MAVGHACPPRVLPGARTTPFFFAGVAPSGGVFGAGFFCCFWRSLFCFAVPTIVMAVGVLLERARQVFSGVRMGIARHLLRRARGDDLPAERPALGPEIDHPIGRLDHVEIMLDHHDGSPAVEELAKCG